MLEAASAEGEALALAIERRLAQANELGHGDKDMAATYLASAPRQPATG